MTVRFKKYSRVTPKARALIGADLITRYTLPEIKKLFDTVIPHHEWFKNTPSENDVHRVIAELCNDTRSFLSLLEYITSPLLFGNDYEKHERVLSNYENLLKPEIYDQKDGRWYEGPTPEMEAQGGFDIWLNSDGDIFEFPCTSNLNQTYVYVAPDAKGYFYAGQRIKWNSSSDIYKAFDVLFKTADEDGFCSFVDYERAYRKIYKKHYEIIVRKYEKKSKGFKYWALKNLTQKGEGILKKTQHDQLIKTVRSKGFQFNNRKVP